MDVETYLNRIAYSGCREPNIETLRALHRAHLEAVPFENLDIHLGQPIVLDEGLLHDKIVGHGRGGFCYELNGLFAALLRDLGFAVALLSARVMDEDGVAGPPFDHMTLEVEADGPWLADVGFGDGFSEPLRLDDPGIQQRHGIDYRLTGAGDHMIMSRREPDGAWRGRYRFSRMPHQLAAFAACCRHHQTSPDSHFTQSRVCSRHTANGLVTLTDDALIVSEAKGRREIPVEDEAAFRRILAEQFGIEI
jgi:N-hydroxyarylamine O-acetyltransferase